MVVAFGKTLSSHTVIPACHSPAPSPGHSPAHSPALDFLREKLALIANVPGPSKTFFADIVQPRPDFEVLSTYAGWGARVQQEVLHAQARKNCQLAWIGVFVDEKGVALVLQ